MSVRCRVLFVEDEPVLRIATERLLSLHFEVTAVDSVAAALSALRRLAFDVVVTDVVLGEERGEEVLAYVAQQHPGIMRVALSGTPLDQPELAHAILEKAAAGPSEIVDVIRSLCPRS